MVARRFVLASLVGLSLVAGWISSGTSMAAGDEACPNAAARQGPSASLPDCRAYEQVTPASKGATIDLFGSHSSETAFSFYDNVDTGYAAEDGDRFLFSSPASFQGPGLAGKSAYVFSRGVGGWGVTGVSPSGLGVQNAVPLVFDPVDLSAIGVEDVIGSFVNVYAEPALERDLNFAGPLGGPYATVASTTGYKIFEGPTTLVGASQDLSHLVLESEDHELAPGAAGQDAGSRTLYERVGGRLRLVNVATDESLLSPCGAILGVGNSGIAYGRAADGGTHNAVSSDGSKIFFTAPDPGYSGDSLNGDPGCWNHQVNPQVNPPQLYMRVNGSQTVEVSAPTAGVVDPTGPHPAIFVGASTDGSKVFFMSEAELTADDTTHDTELYEYDTDTGALTRISRGASGTADGNVDFVPAISADGSTVYFTAFGQLAPGATALEENQREQGPVNLYRYDTNTGETTYIAQIGGKEYPPGQLTYTTSWYNSQVPGNQSSRPTTVALDSRANWYTTGNGRYLVFISQQNLTGYDSSPARSCESLLPNGGQTRCMEVFRYDASTGSLTCVSCAGGAPVDNALFATRSLFEVPGNLPPRPVSEDGSYVFFDTANVLVPQATPGKVHVYEWHDGTISLISSVGDLGNAFFLGSSADGSDVFFGTHAQLAPSDGDGEGDLYDARIGGGFAGAAAAGCGGSSGCPSVPVLPPSFATPPSVILEGAGNLPPPHAAKTKPRPRGKAKAKKCPRGRVKRNGKCVKITRRSAKKGRK